MRIDSATIGMDFARAYTAKTVQYTGVRFATVHAAIQDVNQGKTTDDTKKTEETAGKEEAAKTENEDRGLDLQNRYQSIVDRLNSTGTNSSRESLHSVKQQCIQYLFQLIFNRKPGYTKRDGEIVSGEEATTGTTSKDSTSSDGIVGDLMSGRGTMSMSDWLKSQGFMSAKTVQFSGSMEYYHQETENTTFKTTGMVKTADGREISFGLSLEMSRSFEEYYQEKFDFSAANFCDPLVINLDGNIAELSDQKFMFDIDNDGEKDSISRLGEGSGYLALDKNGDGEINNGSELFGTSSGDGFSDLAIYDEDGNGWIDENDSIWQRLKVWTQNEDGEDELYTLKESGVGAICLQRANTDFTLNNDHNETNGAIRKTGIFLYENGNVGTVQHLDLAK